MRGPRPAPGPRDAGGRARRRGADDGAGSVLALGLVALVLVLVAAVAALGQVEVARARAQGAADLAALAGATRLLALGEVGPSCVLAGRAVERNDAVLDGCTQVRGGVLEVRVHRGTPFGAATAVARAGPASAREP